MRTVVCVAMLLVAASAMARDPAATGRFAVGTRRTSVTDPSRGRTFAVELAYPARAEGRDARVRRGRRSLVLVVHGHCGFGANYEYLTAHLASRGFVVAAPDLLSFCVTRGSLDVTGAVADLSFLRAALRDRAGTFGDFARVVRGSATGVVGHSLGGLAVLTATQGDPAFTTVVALAPAVAGANAAPFASLEPRRAVLVMGGTADTTLPLAATAAPFFAALPSPAVLVEIAGGTHSGFTDRDAGLTPAALAAQQTVVNRYATAFLEQRLRHRRRAGRVLVDGTDGLATVTTKTE